MTDSLMELAERARRLSVEDRSRLVDLLLQSLNEPALREVESAWRDEIARRVAAYDRGEVETVDADLVFTGARRLAP